jgi:hypothetical protein
MNVRNGKRYLTFSLVIVLIAGHQIGGMEKKRKTDDKELSKLEEQVGDLKHEVGETNKYLKQVTDYIVEEQKKGKEIDVQVVDGILQLSLLQLENHKLQQSHSSVLEKIITDSFVGVFTGIPGVILCELGTLSAKLFMRKTRVQGNAVYYFFAGKPTKMQGETLGAKIKNAEAEHAWRTSFRKRGADFWFGAVKLAATVVIITAILRILQKSDTYNSIDMKIPDVNGMLFLTLDEYWRWFIHKFIIDYRKLSRN